MWRNEVDPFQWTVYVLGIMQLPDSASRSPWVSNSPVPGDDGEDAQGVQKPFGSSRAEGLSTVETAQMAGGRSQQTNEEVAMADRVDGLLDDFPGQPRSHRPDVGRLIDESGGRNADVLNSLDSSRMLRGESLSVSGCHEQHHRTEWAGNLSPAFEWNCIRVPLHPLRERALARRTWKPALPGSDPCVSARPPAATDTYSDFVRSRSTNF